MFLRNGGAKATVEVLDDIKIKIFFGCVVILEDVEIILVGIIDFGLSIVWDEEWLVKW